MAARPISHSIHLLESDGRALNAVAPAVHQMKGIALNRLSQMFDHEKQLFCKQVKQGRPGIICEGGPSPRSTAIALMGLRRVEETGGISPIDLRGVFTTLLTRTDWIADIGDVGLFVWASALVMPERLDEVIYRLDLPTALSRLRGAQQGCTVKLAWFLAGLCQACSVERGCRKTLAPIASAAYQRLAGNQGDEGIFCSYSGRMGIRGLLSSRCGTFPDQAYSIYALARFAEVLQNPSAGERALDCALSICETQGPLGQWWSRYDSISGMVSKTFPVYSVHQHGIASMALLTLGELIGADFNPWVDKGIKWILANEIGAELVQPELAVIWRGIDRTAQSTYLQVAANILRGWRRRYANQELRVLKECHSGELGWLLYGFSVRDKALLSGRTFCGEQVSGTRWAN